MEFEFGSSLLAYALEREDIVVEKTKGEMISLQAQVPQHINEKNKESKQSRANNKHYKHTKTNHQTTETSVFQLKRGKPLKYGSYPKASAFLS
jgi:hypothetical protein